MTLCDFCGLGLECVTPKCPGSPAVRYARSPYAGRELEQLRAELERVKAELARRTDLHDQDGKALLAARFALRETAALAPTAGTDYEQRIRADERERCAKVAEECDDGTAESIRATAAAAIAIRALSKPEDTQC